MNSFDKQNVPFTLKGKLWSLRHSILAGAALASVFSSVEAFGQGSYYPVNPPGSPPGYGNTYTGITTKSPVDLQYLQALLQSLYPGTTLQVPIPTGESAPSTAQFSAVVAAAIQGVLANTAPAGVTLVSLSNEAVALRTTDRAASATSIAQSILANSPSSAAAVTNLIAISDGLAKSQPTLIDSIMPSILAQAGTVSLVAVKIPQITLVVINDDSTNMTQVASIIGSSLNSISNANLTASQKENAFLNPTTGFLAVILGAPVANNNTPMIDTVVAAATNGGLFSIVPPSGGLSSLDQILTAAYNALPTQTNVTVGALVDGALRSQGGSAAAIASRLDIIAPGTSAYTDAVVGGYTNGTNSLSFQTYVTAHPGLADAAAAGAEVHASISPSTIIQLALTYGTSTTARNVLISAISSNLGSTVSTISAAINPSTHSPYGSATFSDLAYAGASAGPVEQAGNVVSTILQGSSASLTTLNTTVIQNVVDNAIQGVTAAGKTGAFADIVYKAENVARNTSGASAILVRQAIDSLNTAGGSSVSFLGVVAALAGDIFGVNRGAIQTAAYGAGGELQLTGGDVVAAMNGSNLVAAVQSTATQKFTTTISALYAAVNSTSATNSVIADLYGSILANSTEADAYLAAAIKQVPINSVTLTPDLLTADASNALRVSNSGFFGVNPTLQTVEAVVTHIKTEAIGGTFTDLLEYLGNQINNNPTAINDIAIAATVVDPDHAHFISHAIAVTSPLSAFATVNSIFSYAQITNPTPFALPSAGNPSGALGTKVFTGNGFGTIIDQPAAAAAITAGLTTGILEANLSTANTQTALSNAVAAAVAASITQNGTLLKGPSNPFNAPGDTGKSFQQSDGGVGTFTNTQTVGAAGAITGYIAEVTKSGDTTISAITAAVLQAAVGGGARPYALAMAQAAGQALRWVAGSSVVTATAAADIANAMLPSVTGFASLTQLENAVTFGITQAAAGVIGAGALGLNATGLNLLNGTLQVKATGNTNSDFYLLRSATGTPVTDIFNL